MRPQPRCQPGDKIGGCYQVHQVLMGGMGEVYLCLDLETTVLRSQDLSAVIPDQPD